MSFWHRNRRDDGDSDLDQWIEAALEAELAERDAVFDFEAGLADVYVRAGMLRPSIAQQPGRSDAFPSAAPNLDDAADGAGDDPDLGAVQVVVDHITMVDTLVASVTRTEDTPVLPASYLSMARQFLVQLRTGLAARRLTQREAYTLIQTVRHNIRQADQILRRQHGRSLEQAVHDRIGELKEVSTDLAHQLDLLEERVMRLFDQAGEPALLVPTPS